MENSPPKKPQARPNHDELVGLLPTEDWSLVTGGKVLPVKGRTLEEIVRITHTRHRKGEAPGLIAKLEDELELDLMQIQELWVHLGLPI